MLYFRAPRHPHPYAPPNTGTLGHCTCTGWVHVRHHIYRRSRIAHKSLPVQKINQKNTRQTKLPATNSPPTNLIPPNLSQQLTSTPLGKKRAIGRPMTYSMRCCSHEFHKSCIKTWFGHEHEKADGKQSRSCPMCRAVETPDPKAAKKKKKPTPARARAHTHAHDTPRVPAQGVRRARAATAGAAAIVPPPPPARKRGFFSWLFRRGRRGAGGDSEAALQRQSSSFTRLAERDTQPLPPQPATTAAPISIRPPARQRPFYSGARVPIGHHDHYDHRAAVWPSSGEIAHEPLLGEGTRSERYQIRMLAPSEPLPAGSRLGLATASAAAGAGAGAVRMVLVLAGPAGASAARDGVGLLASAERARSRQRATTATVQTAA